MSVPVSTQSFESASEDGHHDVARLPAVVRSEQVHQLCDQLETLIPSKRRTEMTVLFFFTNGLGMKVEPKTQLFSPFPPNTLTACQKQITLPSMEAMLKKSCEKKTTTN